MACPRCGSALFDGTSPCPQCGYEDRQSVIETVFSVPDPAAAETESPSRSADALDGYLSYTSKSSSEKTSGYSDPYVSDPDSPDGSEETGKEWIPYASVICGALSAYSAPMILPGILLGISAVILGIVGRSSAKKKLSVIGIIVGLIGMLLSVLVILFYLGIFRLVYDFLTGGFGFRMFGGW